MSSQSLLPHPPAKKEDYQSRFNFRVERELNDTKKDVRKLRENRLAGVVSATAAPTGNAYAQGDKVWNSNPAVAGGAGSQYVVIGWICTVAGSPGTWVEMRTLTGT